MNWLGVLTRQAQGGMGDAWCLGPRCLASPDHRWGPAFRGAPGNTEPELGLRPVSDLGVFGEAEPGMNEKHPGMEAGGWP